ncbi:MAG: hypothetical protein QW417_00160 [Zestosphaera sp.]
MKPFLRSPLPIVGVVLITFTVLSVTTVFLSATSLITNIMSNISELAKWELSGSKYGFPLQLGYKPGERPTEYVPVNEGVKASKEILEGLSSDLRISNYLIIQVVNLYVNYSDLSTVSNPLIFRVVEALANLPVLVLYGVKLSDIGISQDVALSSYVVENLSSIIVDMVDEANATKASLFNLLFNGLNYTTEYSRELSDMLDELRQIHCLEYYTTQFYRSCVAYNPLTVLKSPIVWDSSTFEKIGMSHLNTINDRLKILNISVEYYTVDVLVFIDLKTESYFNPASIQGSLENAGAVANDLRSSLNLARLTNAPLQEILSGYQVIETAFRVSSVTGVLPAFVALIVVLQPISEMLVLSVRRVFGLMRVRGISQAVVRKWFYSVLLLSLVSGLCLGLLISYLLAISYFRLYNPMQVLTDPTILIMLAILLVIELLILTRRISRVASSISPSETLKTTLIPESLLEPAKMGGFGWFSVGVGLYFIVTGITNYSATRLLTTSLIGAPGGSNVALIVVLAIIAMFESLLKPFAPAVAAYGFIKLYMINHEKFWDFLHKSVLSKSSLALPSKSIALTIRRRVTPILVLLAFSTSIMTQSILYSYSMNSLVDSATRASVGSEFLLKKDLKVSLTSNTTLRESLNTSPDVLEVLSKSYDGASSVLVFSVWSSVKVGSESYSGTVPLVIVLNPNTFLQNTYWYNEWSLRGNLSNSINEVSSEGKVVVVRELTTFIASASVDLRNVSVSLIRPYPYSSEVFSPEVIDVWSGFPGGPSMYLMRGSPALVAGDWILDMPNLTESLYAVPGPEVGVNYTGLTIYVYSFSNSTTEELISEGFTLVKSLEDLKNDPLVKIVRSLITSTGGSSETYLVFMLLSAGIAVVVAYVVALETGKTALLMRVRGLTPSGMLKLNSLYWFTVIVTSVIIGVVIGLTLGLSDLNTYISPGGLGASLTYLFSQLLGLKGLQLGLGVLRVVVSPVLTSAILLTSVLMPLIPILTIQLVYRGQVRERFIEVR